MAIKVTSQDITRDFCTEQYNVDYLIYIKEIQSFAKYLLNRGFYKIMKPEEFEKMVYTFMVSRYSQNITTAMTRDIMNQVKMQIANVRDNITDANYIAFNDKLLNLETLEYEDFNKDKVTFYKVGISSQDIGDYSQSNFIKFIREILVDKQGNYDQELEFLVQEMFGYCLLNTLESHASFFLVGDGNNGKSVLLALLREMVGPEYTTSMSIEYMTTNTFAKANLIGKKINICVEEESKYTRADQYKALVSGDEVMVEYKYGSSFAWKPTVKYIFATNKLPTFDGFNQGLLRRIKIIPCNYEVKRERQDTKLISKLLKEMHHIVSWSLDGAKRLINNGFQFTESKQSKAKLQEFAEQLSSGILFMRENYEEYENGQMWYEDIYESYKLWCNKRGKKQMSYYNFFSDINKVYKEDGEGVNEEVVSNYKKIRLKTYEYPIPNM